MESVRDRKILGPFLRLQFGRIRVLIKTFRKSAGTKWIYVIFAPLLLLRLGNEVIVAVGKACNHYHVLSLKTSNELFYGGTSCSFKSSSKMICSFIGSIGTKSRGKNFDASEFHPLLEEYSRTFSRKVNNMVATLAEILLQSQVHGARVM